MIKRSKKFDERAYNFFIILIATPFILTWIYNGFWSAFKYFFIFLFLMSFLGIDTPFKHLFENKFFFFLWTIFGMVVAYYGATL